MPEVLAEGEPDPLLLPGAGAADELRDTEEDMVTSEAALDDPRLEEGDTLEAEGVATDSPPLEVRIYSLVSIVGVPESIGRMVKDCSGWPALVAGLPSSRPFVLSQIGGP